MHLELQFSLLVGFIREHREKLVRISLVSTGWFPATRLDLLAEGIDKCKVKVSEDETCSLVSHVGGTTNISWVTSGIFICKCVFICKKKKSHYYKICLWISFLHYSFYLLEMLVCFSLHHQLPTNFEVLSKKRLSSPYYILPMWILDFFLTLITLFFHFSTLLYYLIKYQADTELNLFHLIQEKSHHWLQLVMVNMFWFCILWYIFLRTAHTYAGGTMSKNQTDIILFNQVMSYLYNENFSFKYLTCFWILSTCVLFFSCPHITYFFLVGCLY